MKKKKYYREYTAQWGYGVMIAFDSVWAYSREEAINAPMRFRYGYSNGAALEYVMQVPPHLEHLTDGELEEAFGLRNNPEIAK